MRTVIIIIAALIGTSIGQNYRASQDAAILSDARYLEGDGAFGAAYSQEDGVQFKEESDANGDRKGSYSYVDPGGHRRTVFYTAGKNGFQAIGDHIPTARPVVAPQPEYEPLPQYNPPDYRPPPPTSPPPRQYQAEVQPRSHYAQESIYQPQPEPRYYPRPQYQRPPPPAPSPPPPTLAQPVFRPEPQYQPQYRPPRPLAFQPQPDYNRPQAQSQYQPRPQYEPRPQPHRPYSPHRPHYEPQSAARPQSPGPYSPIRPQYESHDGPRPRYNEITTPVPRRIHPPGKLDFNRTPEGFSYTFSKV